MADKPLKLEKGQTASRKIKSDGTKTEWRVKGPMIFKGAGPRRDKKLSDAEKKALGSK